MLKYTLIALLLTPTITVHAEQKCDRPVKVEMGLKQAIAIKKLKGDGALSSQVKKYVVKIEACTPKEQALVETGIKPETIQKLEMLAPNVISVNKDSHAIANTLVRGLTVANRTGEIGAQAQISYQVQSVVIRLRRGEAIDAARERVGLARSVVDRVLVLGGK